MSRSEPAPADDRPSAPSAVRLAEVLHPGLLQLAWLQAVIATGGSLYLSEVLKLIPCVLCWYQRIAMYPLVVILTIGLLVRERRIRLYVLPFSLIGLAISAYHNLLYYHILPERFQPCTAGASCTAREIEWLGFISISLLALVAFSVISVCLLLYVPEDGTEQAFYDNPA